MLDEVFGKVALEKDKKMFKVHAEARTSYSYQTLNIISTHYFWLTTNFYLTVAYICSIIDFKQSVGHVIQFLHKAITSTKRDDMEKVLGIINYYYYNIFIWFINCMNSNDAQQHKKWNFG